MASECLEVEAPSLDDSSVQGETAGCWGLSLLLCSDGNQSRQMSPTAGANGLSDRAGPAWDILHAPWPRSSPDRGKSSMGPPSEAADLLAKNLPLLLPGEASLGVGACPLHPGQFDFSFVRNGHLNY